MQYAVEFGAEAIGLLRSEFLVPEDGRLPDAAFYRSAFRKLCETAAGLPLTIRLFDVAVSKRPSWLPLAPVDAGVLGRQGVRLYADEPVHGIYLAQLQAIAALAPEFEVRVLLPYVADLAELQYWRDDIKQQLAYPVAVGAMAETPAAALQLREWLEVVEFVAIGCNDLMQCLFGADRDQPELHRYLDPYAPALYRFLRQVADAVQDRLDAVQLCGVLPQLPGILPLLLGLGYRAFSVEATLLPYLWSTIAGTHAGDARMLAERVCRARSSAPSAKYWVRPDIGNHNSKVRSWPILLKTPVSASGEKFLVAMRGFVITDRRGHKCFPVRTAHPTVCRFNAACGQCGDACSGRVGTYSTYGWNYP